MMQIVWSVTSHGLDPSQCPKLWTVH